MRECLLSTKDNPFNPFTNFDDWNSFDCRHGYCSLSYLARIARISNDLSDEINCETVENAIDEIIERDPLNIYVKIVNELNENDSKEKT